MALKILYCGLQHENYNPKRGLSFEYNNFYLPMKRLEGVDVIEHPFDRILEVGKKKFNEELLAVVLKEKPDLLFAFMYTDEFDRDILLKIRNETDTKTIAWFADDYWRFFNYSRHWAHYFGWAVTSYSPAMPWYKDEGIENIILSQWGVDTEIYKPIDIPKDIEVSFVGQYKPGREKLLRFLGHQGIKVEAFGYGWGGTHGRGSGARSRTSDSLQTTRAPSEPEGSPLSASRGRRASFRDSSPPSSRPSMSAGTRKSARSSGRPSPWER